MNMQIPKVTSEANVVVVGDQSTNEASDEIHVSAAWYDRKGNQTVEVPYREKVLLLCRDLEIIGLDDPTKSIRHSIFWCRQSTYIC